jgi:hypothetical protein
MFEEYLQDSYHFLSLGDGFVAASNDREARRYYRASVFYASGALEAFVNYIANAFAEADSITLHETSFLNDKALVFSVDKGVVEKTEYHGADDKLRLLMHKFVPVFDFQSLTWVNFMEFKRFRDSLVHPRQADDETAMAQYHKKVADGLRAIIQLMDTVSRGMFKQPLRRQLLDLIPDSP